MNSSHYSTEIELECIKDELSELKSRHKNLVDNYRKLKLDYAKQAKEIRILKRENNEISKH